MSIHTIEVYPDNLRPFLHIELPHYPYTCDYGIVIDPNKLSSFRPHLCSGTLLLPYKRMLIKYDTEKPRPTVYAKPQPMGKNTKHISQTFSLRDIRFWGAQCDKMNESYGGGGS